MRSHKAGCFNALSAVGRGRAFAKSTSGYGARLSKTSRFEEWKGTNRKFAKSQSRMFQCSLSRRKEASSDEAGFRLRVRLSKTSEFEEWKGTNRKFAKPQSRMFQCSLSRRKEASFGEAGFRLRVRLSKTSEFEEWKGTNRKFAKPQSRMFQCSLSRRKEASFSEAGFRLRREVIITRNIPQEKKGIPLNFLASCGTINPEPITLLSNSHIL